MSLTIDANRVKQVLLADDWHEVMDDSFEIVGDQEGMSFREGDGMLHIPAAWAKWTERDSYNTRQMFSPLTALQAVSYGWTKIK